MVQHPSSADCRCRSTTRSPQPKNNTNAPNSSANSNRLFQSQSLDAHLRRCTHACGTTSEPLTLARYRKQTAVQSRMPRVLPKPSSRDPEEADPREWAIEGGHPRPLAAPSFPAPSSPLSRVESHQSTITRGRASPRTANPQRQRLRRTVSLQPDTLQRPGVHAERMPDITSAITIALKTASIQQEAKTSSTPAERCIMGGEL